MLLQNAEALAQKCSAKKVFLKISQNSQESNCARAPFLTKMQAEACIFTYWHLRFPGNFENYLSAAFLIEYIVLLKSLYYFLLVFSEVVTRRCSAVDLKLY